MVRTVVRLAKIMEIVLGEKNLTVNQFRMLTFIEDGAPPLAELTRRLVMKQPNVSVLIDGLVDRDLAVRERDPADGRRRQLRLTRTGLEVLREAEAACDAAGIPFAPVNRPEDLYDDPQLVEGGGLVETKLADGRTTRLPKIPLRLGDHDFGLRHEPPKVGQGSREMLRELGLEEDEIADLVDRGVVAIDEG